MRRTLAIAFAAAALLLAAYTIYAGLQCGARVVSACGSTEECAALSQCEPRVHPLAPIYAALAVGAGIFAWRGEPYALLLAGVLGAALGTLFGFSLGPTGVAISLLLVAGGIALAPGDAQGWLALAAALLAPALLALLIVAGGAALAFVWLVVFAPPLLWVAASAFLARRRPRAAP